MSDLANEDAMSEMALEGTGSPAATTSASKANNKDNAKSNPAASILLKVWNAVMIVSTAILSFYVFVLKDNSDIPFVVLGVIGLCLPPTVEMFKTMARNKQLRIEYEEQLRKAELARIQQAREREIERLKRDEMMAASEVAEQNAINNIDVAAYKVNNNMPG